MKSCKNRRHREPREACAALAPPAPTLTASAAIATEATLLIVRDITCRECECSVRGPLTAHPDPYLLYLGLSMTLSPQRPAQVSALLHGYMYIYTARATARALPSATPGWQVVHHAAASQALHYATPLAARGKPVTLSLPSGTTVRDLVSTSPGCEVESRISVPDRPTLSYDFLRFRIDLFRPIADPPRIARRRKNGPFF